MKHSNVKYAPRFQPKFKFKIPSVPNSRRNPLKSIQVSTRGGSTNATSPELPVVKPLNGTATTKPKSNADPSTNVTSRHKKMKGNRRKNQPLAEALPSIAESDEDRTIEDILQTADITSEQGESVDTGVAPWCIFGDSQPQDGQPRKDQGLPSKVFDFPHSPGRGKQKSKSKNLKKERQRKIKSNLLRTIFKTCKEIKKIKERRQKLLGPENTKQVARFVQSASIPVTVSTAARININSKYQVAPSSSVEEESFGMRGATLEKKLPTAVSQAFLTEE
ncbi:PREDICTED: uncharacterized protein LOC109475522 [Branchiostoma belcheri]|uniref:Uncharacterized protein LOC109475522 n=1 Tax=Branchiostoma belcheri TaxID=7741 RepID=A0A6P4Z557_BRABE|nr:PREDICTED: uncharacterized protein LOC109475522 [Branchiostoma belcheri]